MNDRRLIIRTQNDNYDESLMLDIEKNNRNIEQLMDKSDELHSRLQSHHRINLMNSLTPQQRRRLMTGESLEQILNIAPDKYYLSQNPLDIPDDALFEYSINHHLLAFDVRKLEIQTINNGTLSKSIVRIPIPISNSFSNPLSNSFSNSLSNPLSNSFSNPLSNSFSNPLSNPLSNTNNEYIIIDEDTIEFIRCLKNNIQFNQFSSFNPKDSNPNPKDKNPKNSNPKDEKLNKEIKKIQNLLYDNLLPILDDEHEAKTYAFSKDVVKIIKQNLEQNRFQFEIVAELLEPFM